MWGELEFAFVNLYTGWLNLNATFLGEASR